MRLAPTSGTEKIVRQIDLLWIGEMAHPEAEQSKEIEEEEDRAVLEMRLRQAWLDREWAEVTLKVKELGREREAGWIG